MDILNQLQSDKKITDEVFSLVANAVESGADLESALLEQEVDKNIVRDAFAAFYVIPAFVLTEENHISQEVLEYVPPESAKHYHIVPLAIENDMLIIAVNDPEDLQLRQALNFISAKHNLPYKFKFALKIDLEKLLKQYDNLTGEVDQALTSLETELDEEIAVKQTENNNGQSLTQEHIKEDAPVTKIVATVLRYAVDGGASDIHIEPTGAKVQVRFRVDGLLGTSLELPKNVQAAVVARIKILSSMRLDEKRKPQDGRFSATFDGRRIDFRVSILPTNHGEKVVMRILDNDRGVSKLEDTGISAYHLDAIRKMVNEPFGIILISGPTGSGKSTTLYTMVSEIDRSSKNVLSLEDPIEYNIDGVSQSQMRPEIGYTFANGLRTALRQDPDIILVGEIRDKETAQLAIQAALTGHLVLSTIHTNNSIGVIPRLIDMGVDPYLIAPTLKLAMAQRLARRICPGTGIKEEGNASLEMMISKEFETLPEEYRSRIPQTRSVLHPEASPGCASGTKGRVAVMEVLEVDDDIRNLILNEASEAAIYQSARAHGFMSIKEDAIIKSLEGVIPYEEVGVFGTKVGEEDVLSEESVPVDGQDTQKSPVLSEDELSKDNPLE